MRPIAIYPVPAKAVPRHSKTVWPSLWRYREQMETFLSP